MVRNRGQSAAEYMLVVALALLIVVPGSMVFYSYSTDSKASLVNSQIFKLGNTLIDKGAEMYSIGDDSWQTIDITVPEQVEFIKIYNSSDYSELVIRRTDPKPSESVFFSSTPLCNATHCDCTDGCELNLGKGINKIRVISVDGKIHYTLK